MRKAFLSPPPNRLIVPFVLISSHNSKFIALRVVVVTQHVPKVSTHPRQIPQMNGPWLHLGSTFKSILRQKKNYRNSNISPSKNIIFKKSSKRNQNPKPFKIL